MHFGDIKGVCCFSPKRLAMGTNSDIVIRATENIRYNSIIINGGVMSSRSVITPVGPMVQITAPRSFGRVRGGGVGRGRTFSVYRGGVLRCDLGVDLIRIRYAFSGSGLLFCFASSGEISFHRLIGSLTDIFHAHVRLERVNIHSRTGVLNNLNVYNEPFYYTDFLNRFRPISVGVTARRDLSLGPAGVDNAYNELVYYLGCRRSNCRRLLEVAPGRNTVIRAPSNENIIARSGALANGLGMELGSARTRSPFVERRIGIVGSSIVEIGGSRVGTLGSLRG